MLLTSRRWSFIVAFFTFAGFCSARSDDAESVTRKLEDAKMSYDKEYEEFKKGVNSWLDKCQEAARKAGNKKAVDQIKAEQETFEKTGEVPAGIPGGPRDKMRVARARLDRVYTAAIKRYVQLKEDAAADASYKEQQKFRVSTGLAFGKCAYLVALRHTKPQVLGRNFRDDGTLAGVKLTLDGKPVPHTIFLHPAANDHSEVSYDLGGKWTVFRAMVGVPKIDDNSGDPFTALTFEVVADGKSLWKSEAVKTREKFQEVAVPVEKVKVLTLKVHCPGSASWGCAVWYEPIVIE